MTPKVVIGGAMSTAILAVCMTAGAAAADDLAPLWAYPRQQPSLPGSPRPAIDDITPEHVPDSKLTVTLRKSMDAHDVPDWHPEDHPPAPTVILRGQDKLEACGHCHLPNGMGTDYIQAPALAALPADYIVRQFAEFRSGARASAVKSGLGGMMAFVAKEGSDADIEVAAKYFADLPATRRFRVVETAMIPKSEIKGTMWVASPDGGTEPLGMRIIEEPEDEHRTELRDPRSGFIAYVPPGSIKRGEVLVATGAKGKTTPCSACHGADLHGVGPVPAIAGRSPAYIVRQLYDIQQGTRAGVWSPLMKLVVAKLTTDDIVAIAAYTASREP